MLSLKIVIGSTRPTRAADRVAPWVIERAKAHGGFDVEVLDLREWPLPPFQEHMGSIGDLSDPTYSEPIVRQWNRILRDADALLIVTAEYLHSVPGTLKNALDSVFVSWAPRNKPLAGVGYSNGIAAGVRAVEHLMHVGIEMEMVPLRNTVRTPRSMPLSMVRGVPLDPPTNIAMSIMLDDLQWWGSLLARGRADGELAPGALRARAALAQLEGAS